MIIELAALVSAAAASPVGLWTSIPANATGALPRHDALRVSTGLGHALAVRCEHGGWSNLSVLACAFDAATLATDNATEVTLETSGRRGSTRPRGCASRAPATGP